MIACFCSTKLFPIVTAISIISLRGLSLSKFHTQMAWQSSGSSNQELIENLFKNGLITDERIKNAMLKVDRGDFTNKIADAYDDSPKSSKQKLLNCHIDFIICYSFVLVGYAVSRMLIDLTKYFCFIRNFR